MSIQTQIKANCHLLRSGEVISSSDGSMLLEIVGDTVSGQTKENGLFFLCVFLRAFRGQSNGVDCLLGP